MPRKGPWTPPVFVGDPNEFDADAPPINFRPSSDDEAPRMSSRHGKGAKCHVCFDLDQRYIPQPDRDEESCSYGQANRHWISSNDLKRDRSCASCRFLKSAFDTLLNSGEIISIPRGSEIVYYIAILDRSNNDSADKEFLKRKKQAQERYKSSQSLMIEMRCSTRKIGKKDEEGTREEFKVEIYTPPGAPPAPWKAIGAAGEVPTNPTVEDYAKTIQHWLADCDQNHPICQTEWKGPNGDKELLPRRVLDISGGQIRLIETSPRQREHYVALSHCWGKKPLLETTRETIVDHMRGIPFDRLPKTFQDAITITRCLGLRYIWIDSLCIIQHDKADWEQQSALMADIYGRCYLNIATTRAGGGHEGCISGRWTTTDTLRWADEFARQVGGSDDEETGTKHKTISKIRRCAVKSYRIPEATQDIRIRLAIDSAHEALQTPRWIPMHATTAPLLPRGWVYQERFLSARTVHFHANEMVWACNVSQRCECKELDGTPVDGDGWSASKDRVVKLPQNSNLKSIHGLWRTIVEDVSLLDLTYESDRLPSLAGLATRFARYLPRNERYLAGLWEGDLARDLLWESGGSTDADGPHRKRDEKGSAPSWSWACLVWGGSGASSSALEWEYETKPKLAEWAGIKTYKQDSRVKIISASVEVDGENKYGVVKGGRIVIEGPLCAVVVKNPPRPPPASLANVTTVKESIFNSLHLNYDTPTAAASAGGTVYCLFIGSFDERFSHDRHGHITHQGLILRPVSGGNFERIGRWTQHIEDWVKNKDIWTRKSGVHRVSIV
ncbi:HET-domain-containing protein [Agrocybe pediades]|nr:HET-domain-containing protein [Agrocybe pediades]